MITDAAKEIVFLAHLKKNRVDSSDVEISWRICSTLIIRIDSKWRMRNLIPSDSILANVMSRMVICISCQLIQNLKLQCNIFKVKSKVKHKFTKWHKWVRMDSGISRLRFIKNIKCSMRWKRIMISCRWWWTPSSIKSYNDALTYF